MVIELHLILKFVVLQVTYSKVRQPFQKIEATMITMKKQIYTYNNKIKHKCMGLWNNMKIKEFKNNKCK